MTNLLFLNFEGLNCWTSTISRVEMSIDYEIDFDMF